MPYSFKTFKFELHQPINGLQIRLTKDGQPVDVTQTLEPIDLTIEIEEGSHMDITITYNDGTDVVLIETNGTEQLFTRTHQFQKAGDLVVNVTANNLVTHVAASATDDITIQAPVPADGVTMTSDYVSSIASLPTGRINYRIEFDNSFPKPSSPKIIIDYGDGSCGAIPCPRAPIEFVDNTPNVYPHDYTTPGIKTATVTIFNDISSVQLQTTVRIQEVLSGLRIDMWEEGRADVLIQPDDDGSTGVPVGSNYIFRFNYTTGKRKQLQ